MEKGKLKIKPSETTSTDMKTTSIDMNETNKILKNILEFLQIPGVINMDGQKVGDVLMAAQRNIE